MKLKKITVKKLFGVFDHEIPVNNSSGITIVIGENGLGKTVLLEMIKSFFDGKYRYFDSVTFNEIIFEFDDKVKWTVKKEKFDEEEDDDIYLTLTQTNKSKRSFKPLILYRFEKNHFRFSEHNYKRRRNALVHKPYFVQVDENVFLDERTGRLFHMDESIGEQLHFDFRIDEKIPEWFSDRHGKIDISLIETQRLISIEGRTEKSPRKAVEKYSRELAEKIKELLTKSTQLSSTLDRTYPNRLVEKLKTSSNVTDEYLKTQLEKLEEKRKLLNTVGLIVIGDESVLSDSEISDSEKGVVKDVLMLYVEDSFNKIEIFDDVSKKISLLLNIINNRFKHKKLHIDKEKGFLLKSTIIKNKKGEGQEIDVNKLSSGEQNELVLFYLLLFETKPNSLILIDEPEVSLHISWQNQFISDLSEIRKLNSFDVVIATHSPDIIGNNWDLKVELQGLE